MNKYFILLLCAVSLCVSFGLNSKASADENQTAIARTTPMPKAPVKIEKIEFERDEVVSVCPDLPENRRKDFDDSGLNKITIVISNPENRAFSFQYTVSAGRITGQRESAIWDLRDVSPGTYTFTAKIEDGKSINESKTREIKVIGCPVESFGACPRLSVKSGKRVRARESMRFKAEVSGGSATGITYQWTISAGKITEGQGTPEIKVKAASKKTRLVKATVEIKGSGLLDGCQRNASAITEIIQ
jgi:hypothetical protein